MPRAGDPQSEAALVEKYGVSRGTVRRAVRELETAGHVEARHGVGRFVSSRP
ncbi:GntR family transcriptional regulator [Streptomyces sp. NBC_00009]|uniref:GntR family transcriptional regulator n=1 Tax=Streptomyces sp. NBC_00009 TaxID=2975620 RepID=UPI003864796F